MPRTEQETAEKKHVTSAIANAKAKNARLRLLKERNENYLAEQKDYEDEINDELTKELTVSATK